MYHYRQHAMIEPEPIGQIVLDYLVAITIGAGLGLALVSWWCS